MTHHLDAKAWAELLQAQPVANLQHLLTCARCRRRLAEVLFELDPQNLDNAEASAPHADAKLQLLTSEILERAFARLTSRSEAPADLQEAKRLVDELLGMPQNLRIEAVETQSRYHLPEAVELLLAKATSSPDPSDSRHLAALAGAVLGFLTGTAQRQRVESRVACALGDSERRMGRLDLAEDIFREAANALRDQPLILQERLVLCRALATLRQEQGRIDEALGLLEHAALVAEELGDYDALAQTRLAYGWLLLEEYDAERAILPIQEALSLSASVSPPDPAPQEAAEGIADQPAASGDEADLEPDPHTALSALYALALAYADLGDDEGLAETFKALDQLAPRLHDPLDPVRILWIRARAEARRDQYDVALPLFQEVFETLLRQGPGPEAAFAALDLARAAAELLMEPSFPDRLEQIAHRLFALPPDRLPLHLRDVLRFALDFPKHRTGAFLDVLLSASAYLERARFNPSFPFQPTPEPERVASWRDLTNQQRRRIASAAGVRLNQHGFPRSLADQNLISWTHEAFTGVRIQLPLVLDEDETRD